MPLVTGFGGQVSSVFVLNNTDVYAAGYENNGAGTDVAKVWLNNTPTVLTDSKHEAKATAVYVRQTKAS